MLRKNEILKVKYYSALFILAGLLFSLVMATQPKSSATAIGNEDEVVSDKTPAHGYGYGYGYGNTPILFEMNEGQTDKRAKFIARGSGYTLYLAESEAMFSLKVPLPDEGVQEMEKKPGYKKFGLPDTLTMRFAGSKAGVAAEGGSKAMTKTNYYIGKNRLENIPNYRMVNYRELYEGVDATFYGDANNRLEYDFVIKPNADPTQIALDFEGSKTISVNTEGDLIIKTANAEMVQHKLFSYQEIEGARHEIASRYILSDENTIKFELGDYDHSKPLVIDPALSYLTYLGGAELDTISKIAADKQGNVYVSGTTESLNFLGQTRNSSDKSGAFVTKLDPTGTQVIYKTILEGNNDDTGESLVLDSGNNVYVVGQASRDFPTTAGAYDTNLGGGADTFVAKLDAQGVIVYSTLVGGGAGQDNPFDVAVDASGKAYVTGRTLSGLTFPKKNEYQGCGTITSAGNTYDIYLTVINTAGTDITYSTCIGGSYPYVYEDGFSIALDASNNAYIAGRTNAPNFPVKNAFQPERGGGIDAFVAKFNPAASGEASLVYSTFLGGSGTDTALGIAVDSSGQAYVTGFTGSTNFPLQNAFRSINQVNEAFVSVISANGLALVNSTFLGDSGQEQGSDIALGENGLIYIVGETDSTFFPVALPFQPAKSSVRDAFVTKLRFGTGVMSSSLLGGNGNDFGKGIAVQGNFIYVAGETQSNNLSTTPGVIKQTSAANSPNSDGFVAKVLDTHQDSVGVFRPASTFLLTQSTTTVVSQAATFTAQLNGANGVAGDWDGDSVDTIASFTNGTWKLRNINFPGIALFPPAFGIKTVTFGAAGDLPVGGDWDGDGIDTPGVFRPSTGQFILTDSTSTSPPTVRQITRANFGTAGDLPISGDWDGDGKDSIAVYRTSTGETFFTNDDMAVRSGFSNTPLNPDIDIVAFLGIAEDLPFAGDWNGDGKDSLGLWRPSTTEMILSDDNVNLRAVFLFGLGTDQPIAGDWDGKPNP